mmetsp:Transcript_11228/g.27450  ORF Transcript_11228/g.27450 Transcript_11228/m.27450 type:complete len:1042 (+) Transcript_11228:492-3617(+)
MGANQSKRTANGSGAPDDQVDGTRAGGARRSEGGSEINGEKHHDQSTAVGSSFKGATSTSSSASRATRSRRTMETYPGMENLDQIVQYEQKLLRYARCTVQVHDMRIPSRDGETFHFAECHGRGGIGGGLPMVFIHGYGGSLCQYYRMMKFLVERWAGPLFFLDLPGMGASARKERMFKSPVEVERFFARRLRFWCDTILGKDQKFVLVAHSFGAYVGTAFAHTVKERVAAIVLLSPCFGFPKSRAHADSDKGLREHAIEYMMDVFEADGGPLATAKRLGWAGEFVFRKALRSRLSALPQGPELDAFVDHLAYMNCSLPVGTESALTSTFGHYLVTKAETPLIERVDFDVPLISFYGDNDWMDRQGGAYIGDIGVIPGCTHHMHLEFPRLVTRCIMYFLKHNLDDAKKGDLVGAGDEEGDEAVVVSGGGDGADVEVAEENREANGDGEERKAADSVDLQGRQQDEIKVRQDEGADDSDVDAQQPPLVLSSSEPALVSSRQGSKQLLTGEALAERNATVDTLSKLLRDGDEQAANAFLEQRTDSAEVLMDYSRRQMQKQIEEQAQVGGEAEAAAAAVLQEERTTRTTKNILIKPQDAERDGTESVSTYAGGTTSSIADGNLAGDFLGTATGMADGSPLRDGRGKLLHGGEAVTTSSSESSYSGTGSEAMASARRNAQTKTTAQQPQTGTGRHPVAGRSDAHGRQRAAAAGITSTAASTAQQLPTEQRSQGQSSQMRDEMKASSSLSSPQRTRARKSFDILDAGADDGSDDNIDNGPQETSLKMKRRKYLLRSILVNPEYSHRNLTTTLPPSLQLLSSGSAGTPAAQAQPSSSGAPTSVGGGATAGSSREDSMPVPRGSGLSFEIDVGEEPPARESIYGYVGAGSGPPPPAANVGNYSDGAAAAAPGGPGPPPNTVGAATNGSAGGQASGSAFGAPISNGSAGTGSLLLADRDSSARRNSIDSGGEPRMPKYTKRPYKKIIKLRRRNRVWWANNQLAVNSADIREFRRADKTYIPEETEVKQPKIAIEPKKGEIYFIQHGCCW